MTPARSNRKRLNWTLTFDPVERAKCERLAEADGLTPTRYLARYIRGQPEPIAPAVVAPRQTLAQQLRSLREDAGISQYEMARRLGVTRGEVKLLEGGKRGEPTQAQAEAWKEACSRG